MSALDDPSCWLAMQQSNVHTCRPEAPRFALPQWRAAK